MCACTRTTELSPSHNFLLVHLDCCRQTFQYFGLDFLVDDSLHPWLMEVNATPSMKVAHEDPATQQLIHDQKWEFVQDSFQLLHATQHTFEEVRCARDRFRLLRIVQNTSWFCTE